MYYYTIDHSFSSPISAQHFKADIIYGSFVTGPRVIELDGFSVPEPATLALLATGGLAMIGSSAFRRKTRDLLTFF
jgi:hypothetical protein